MLFRSYNLFPTGNVCPGTDLFLSGSEPDAVYHIFINNNLIKTVAGIGGLNLLPLGRFLLTGTLKVVAQYIVTGCYREMLGATNLLPSPIDFEVFPHGIMCQTDSIWLSGSQIGVIYQVVLNDSVIIGPTVNGTGDTLKLGITTVPGIYKVKATELSTNCWVFLSDTITLFSPPVIYQMHPSGEECSPKTIFLTESEDNCRYDLIFNRSYPPIMSIQGYGGGI